MWVRHLDIEDNGQVTERNARHIRKKLHITLGVHHLKADTVLRSLVIRNDSRIESKAPRYSVCLIYPGNLLYDINKAPAVLILLKERLHIEGVGVRTKNAFPKRLPSVLGKYI
jgi:hypothetical protein